MITPERQADLAARGYPVTEEYTLTQPQFPVGTKLDPKRLMTSWHRRQILREQIAETIKILRQMRKQGYADQKKDGGTMIGTYNKDRIRQVMAIIDNAHSAEVAGTVASSVHVVGSHIHPSYLEGEQSHSGVMNTYQILFRAKINGNDLCTITRGAHFYDNCLADGVIEPVFTQMDPDLPETDPFDVTGFDQNQEGWELNESYLQLMPSQDFVAYWYGTPDRYYAKTLLRRMNSVHVDIYDADWKLPDGSKSDDARKPVRLDIAKMCGWRFTSKGHYSSTPWRVAHNKQEAFEAAAAFARAKFRRRDWFPDPDRAERTFLGAIIEKRLHIAKHRTMDELIDGWIAEERAKHVGEKAD